MKAATLSLVVLLPLFLAPPSPGQSRSFKVDPNASTIAFNLGASLHAVHGVFHVERGAITFDPSASKISGAVVVSAGSGNSGDASRDKKMKKDILDALHFADISFAPQSYQGTISLSGDSSVQVTGLFTLHGTAHDLTVRMQIHIEGAKCTAKTNFVVPYVRWGLKDPSAFVLRVEKEVSVALVLTGVLSG